MDNNKRIIENSVNFVKEIFTNDTSGHDWPHTERVLKMAIHLSKNKKVDTFVVQLSAILHDVDDWKLTDSIKQQRKTVKQWLECQNIDNKYVKYICNIIESLSYKGAGVASEMKTMEGKIVQDADRLDAIGAIGIARAFAYGGTKRRTMHNPLIQPVNHNSFEEYKASQSTTINHFFEKLLLLKDLMNTEEARQIAEKRHKFMELYLEQFFAEWNGER